MNDEQDRMEARQREILARLQDNLTEGLLDLIFRLERLEHAYGLAPQEPMTRLRPLALPEDANAAMEDMKTRLTILEDLAGD